LISDLHTLLFQFVIAATLPDPEMYIDKYNASLIGIRMAWVPPNQNGHNEYVLFLQIMPRKLLKFLILFDNTSLLYFPGQFLSGRVLLELQDDTPALGLHFHVVGEGVSKSSGGRQERTYDKENYIDFRMRLLGDSGQGPSVLSPGIHSL
jgi:hypothetical protein